MKENDLIKILPGSDITLPIGFESNKIIMHVCNDIPVMGAGVAKAIYEKWPIIKENYLKDPTSKKLGTVQMTLVDYDIVIANCIAQHGIISQNGNSPIRYRAFTECAIKVFNYAEKCIQIYKQSASVHVPYNIGCGLAGGKWESIYKILSNAANAYNIKVYIYDKYNQNT